jgi:hypothetical protein
MRRDGAPRVVFATYTMAHPFAVGVFFRALRLGFEFERRGWSVTICNLGPLPEDPKVERAQRSMRLLTLESSTVERETEAALRQFDALRPDLLVFGEEPIPATEPVYLAARMTRAPLACLDQFYDRRVAPRRSGVDLVLLYGLRSLWGSGIDRPGHYTVVPPFIEAVTPAAELPVPKRLLDGKPCVLVVGFDERVLRGGIELVASLDSRPAVITVSHDTAAAESALAASGIASEQALALPLQADADLFGLMALSAVTIVANGFMHITESLALGAPTICIDRGIGMSGWSLHDRFLPFVSIGESAREQRTRLRGWLQGCPFSPALLAGLAQERHGARVSVDHLEAIARRPRRLRRLARLATRALYRGRRWRESLASAAAPVASDGEGEARP